MTPNGLELNGQRSAPIPSRIIATCFALTAFAVATSVGIVVGNSAVTVLWRAIVVMLGCWFVGMLVGAIAERATLRNIERYKQTHPLPNGIEDVRAQQGAGHGEDDSVNAAAPQA